MLLESYLCLLERLLRVLREQLLRARDVERVVQRPAVHGDGPVRARFCSGAGRAGMTKVSVRPLGVGAGRRGRWTHRW